MSEVLRRVKNMQDDLGFPPSESPDISVALNSSSSHPADLISSTSDLSLGDLCPIVLFEHSEQNPPLINNIGMVSRIVKFYRYCLYHLMIVRLRSSFTSDLKQKP